MAAVGGVALATGIAKVNNEWFGAVYDTRAQLARLMSKGPRTIGARGFEIGVETAGAFGYGFPAENGNLPAGASVTTVRPVVYPIRQMHACRLTGLAMQELENEFDSEEAGISWVDRNLKATNEAALKMENIHAWGNGNGVLGTVSTGASSTTQTFTGSGANFNWTRYLMKGMNIQFVDPSSGLPRNTTPVTITSDQGTYSTTITVSSSVSTTTGDYVVTAGGFNGAATGLTKIIDNGTLSSAFFQDINRVTQPKLSANMLSPGGTNTITNSLTLMRRMLANMNQANHGRDGLEIWSHEAQWSVFASLGWSLKRFDGKATKATFGFTSMDFEGVEWAIEPDAPLDKIEFLNWKKIWSFVNKDWSWDKTTGEIWNRVPSTDSGYDFKDAFVGYFVKIYNYGSPDPRGLGCIYNLAVPTGYYG